MFQSANYFFNPYIFPPLIVGIAVGALGIAVFLREQRALAFTANEIIQHMSDALVVLDADGLIRLVNRGACDLFALSEAEMLKKNAAQTLPEIFSGQIEILRRQGRIDEVEISFKKHDEEFFYSFTASVMRDEKGGQVAFVFVIRDISGRKKSEKSLLQKTSELARSKAELEQLELFAFVASHDLQEPLRKITTFGDRLRDASSTLDEKHRDYLSRMESAAARMSQYITDLVEFSRVSSKTNPLEPVDLSMVMREVLMDLDLRIQDRGAKIEVGMLPILNADRLQMRQLFQNLIANALKFSKKDGTQPLIQVSCVRRDGWVDLIVSDNGIGFEEKYAERIFRPFERLHRSEEVQGSGMGLAICHRITLRHEGRITAQSKPGEGSTFTVSFPI